MSFDYEKVGIYTAAFQAFRANIGLLIFAAAFLLGLDALQHAKWSNGGVRYVAPIIIEFVVAFSIHKTIFHGPANNWLGKSEGDDTQKGFYWRSALILVVLVVLMAIPFAISAFIFGMLDLPKEDSLTIAMTIGMLVGLLLYGIFLALWGTILPATVARDDASFKTAYRRGRLHFWYTFGCLLIGPTIFAIALGVLGSLVVKMGVPENVIHLGQFSLTGAANSGLFHFAGLFSTTLAATVLCKTYLRAQSQVAET